MGCGLGGQNMLIDKDLGDFLFNLTGGQAKDLDAADILNVKIAEFVDANLFKKFLALLNEFEDRDLNGIARAQDVFLDFRHEVGGGGVGGVSPAIGGFVDHVELIEDRPFDGFNFATGVGFVEAPDLGGVEEAVAEVEVIAGILQGGATAGGGAHDRHNQECGDA